MHDSMSSFRHLEETSRCDSVDIFSYSVPSGILGSDTIPLKPVLEGVRIVALSISSHEQTQCFLYCRFSLFLSVFQIFYSVEKFNFKSNFDK